MGIIGEGALVCQENMTPAHTGLPCSAGDRILERFSRGQFNVHIPICESNRRGGVNPGHNTCMLHSPDSEQDLLQVPTWRAYGMDMRMASSSGPKSSASMGNYNLQCPESHHSYSNRQQYVLGAPGDSGGKRSGEQPKISEG